MWFLKLLNRGCRENEWTNRSDMKLLEEENNRNLRRSFLLAGITYTLFLIYGSLIPFSFHFIPLIQAFEQFSNIRFLTLSIGSRADWVANLLLYVPFSFLLLAAHSFSTSRLSRLNSILIVLSKGMLLAVAVEFLQIFFAPRTVSLNDIFAEFLGLMIGVSFWCYFGRNSVEIIKQVKLGGLKGLKSFFYCYLLVYLFLSLFPFDFLISLQELSQKADGELTGWLFADIVSERPVRCLLSLLFESLLVVPLGIFLGFRSAVSHKNYWITSVLFAFLFGSVVECLQFFTASGVSQGGSVMTRVVGVIFGFLFFKLFTSGFFNVFRPFGRIFVEIAALPYVFVVFKINGFFDLHWLDVPSAIGKFEGTMLLPLYYHYYSTETTAVLSLLLNIIMYLPVCVGLWLWRWSQSDELSDSYTGIIMSAFLALVIEAGKLFLIGKHPDFTNIIIAAVTTWAGYRMLAYLTRIFSAVDFSSYRELAP